MFREAHRLHRRTGLLAMPLGHETERIATFESELLNSFKKGDCRMRQAGLSAMNDANATLDGELRNGDPNQTAARELGSDTEARHQGDAAAHLNEALDGLERGEFDAHVQRGFVLFEGLHDLLPERRGDGMRDEAAGAQIADRDGTGASEGVTGIDDKGEFVAVDDGRAELWVVWSEREKAELDGMKENIVWNAAGEGSLDGDFDAPVLLAEIGEQRQQIEAGVLVGGNVEAAGVQSAELADGGCGLGAEIEHFEGVFAEDFTRGGEGCIARTAFKEDLAKFCFEFGDGLTYRRLCAMQAGGGAGEAAFLGHREKGFHLCQIHGEPRVSITAAVATD